MAVPPPWTVTAPLPEMTPLKGIGVGTVDSECAVVDHVADDRAAGAAVAKLQGSVTDRRAAGIGVCTGKEHGTTTLDRYRAAAADIAGIGPGKALVEN